MTIGVSSSTSAGTWMNTPAVQAASLTVMVRSAPEPVPSVLELVSAPSAGSTSSTCSAAAVDRSVTSTPCATMAAGTVTSTSAPSTIRAIATSTSRSAVKEAGLTLPPPTTISRSTSSRWAKGVERQNSSARLSGHARSSVRL